MFIYTGGYNYNNDSGIECFKWSKKEKSFTHIATERNCENPSFLVLHPSEKIIYAANEVDHIAKITAYRILNDGTLILIDEVATNGGGMCHIAVNKEGTAIYGANYSTGNVIAVSIKEDGCFGMELSNIVHKGSNIHKRQDCARVHQVIISPDGRRLIAVDFGVNAIFSYLIDSNGAIDESSIAKTFFPDGEGPRHLVFHRNGVWAYVITELGNRVFRCAYDKMSGEFIIKESKLLVANSGDSDITSAEIGIAGKYLYSCVRGINKIVVFDIDEATGIITFAREFSCEGESPRMFSIYNEEYIFIANQDSGNISAVNLSQGSCIKVCVPDVSCVIYN